jgi:hypothetical protein
VSSQLPLNFPTKKPLEVKFSGLNLSTDGGLLLVKQADTNLNLCQRIADCLSDPREQHKIKHSDFQIVSQRIYQILAGYEDVIDSNYLRHDPIFQTICEKTPILGTEALASQPTMSRFENRITETEIKNLRRFFVDNFIASHREVPEEIVLDIDGYDAETHGNQQLSLFHGYYHHKIYFPVLINEAETGYPLILQLRPGNSHPGKGVASLLRWLFWRLRKAWPDVKIRLRADAGFSLPEILNICERSQIEYGIGYSNNNVLKGKISYLIDQARLQYFRTQEKASLFDDVYYAAQTWKEPRRIIMKAEWLSKGANPRFLVTNMDLEPQELYHKFYVKRGASSEHRIKELKLGIKADRLSCHQFIVNQFRLFLYQAAYILMLELRQSAFSTRLAKAQVSRLRETVIKTAAKVTVFSRKILVELASHCPFAEELMIMAERLFRGESLLFA